MTKKSARYLVTTSHGHPRASAANQVYAHILVAEKALGKLLPFGAEVHHVDRNARNNENSNLVICEDRQYHFLLHRRQRIVDAGGNPDTEKICTGCKKVLLRTEFHSNRNNHDKLHNACKRCNIARSNAYVMKKRLAS